MSVSMPEGSINFGGLSSGLDTHKIVDALIDAERKPIARIRAQQEAISTKKSSFERIGGLLRELETSGKKLSGPASLLAQQVQSSAPLQLAATPGVGAASGTFAIDILELAQNDRRYSNMFGSRETGGQFGEGTLSLSVGAAEPIALPVDADTTLTSLASQINDAQLGISATTLADGKGYRLLLTGGATGAANAIQVTEVGTSFGLAEASNVVQAAQDSQIRIDGLSTVTRPTNTLSDVISGITLTALQKTTTPATLSISTDEAAIAKSVEGFVQAYNEVITTVQRVTAAGVKLDRTKLVGDTTLRNLMASLQGAITSPIRSASSDIFAPTQIGLSTKKDGTLTLDSTALADIIKRDSSVVSRVFGRGNGIDGGGLASRVGDVSLQYGQVGAGLLAQRVDGAIRESKNYDKQVERIEQHVEQVEKNLKRQFNQLEETMTKLKQQGNYVNQLSQQSRA